MQFFDVIRWSGFLSFFVLMDIFAEISCIYQMTNRFLFYFFHFIRKRLYVVVVIDSTNTFHIKLITQSVFAIRLDLFICKNSLRDVKRKKKKSFVLLTFNHSWIIIAWVKKLQKFIVEWNQKIKLQKETEKRNETTFIHNHAKLSIVTSIAVK